MKFKIDENIPIEVVEIFSKNRLDCDDVYQENINGKPDEAVMAKCNEDQRVLITLDLDFADIVKYPPELNWGCVVLRIKKQSKKMVVDLIEKNISNFNAMESKLKHRLWIIDEKKIRIRGNN